MHPMQAQVSVNGLTCVASALNINQNAEELIGIRTPTISRPNTSMLRAEQERALSLVKLNM